MTTVVVVETSAKSPRVLTSNRGKVIGEMQIPARRRESEAHRLESLCVCVTDVRQIQTKSFSKINTHFFHLEKVYLRVIMNLNLNRISCSVRVYFIYLLLKIIFFPFRHGSTKRERIADILADCYKTGISWSA